MSSTRFARFSDRRTALVCEDDEDGPPVVLGADTADESGLLHLVDEACEAALAVQDVSRELAHRNTFGRFLEVDEDVVPAQREAGLVLEFGAEQALQRQGALEEQAPSPEPLGRGA